MLTGYVSGKAGQFTLPVLTEWEIQRTDGDPCGSFSVTFAAGAGTEAALKDAAFFQATYEGRVVFSGIVDEYTLSLGADGLLATVVGRDLAGLLLDNECRAAEFQMAHLEDILSRYVRPLGIGKIRADQLGPVSGFAVQTADTCWQVLSGWCRHSGEVRPFFLADGTLCLQKAPETGYFPLSPANGILSAELRRQRYGVVSRQTVLDYTHKTVETVTNPDFDGVCDHVVIREGKTLKATWRTAAQRVADSRRDQVVATVTVAGAFMAEPLDRVGLNLPELEVVGNFTVSAVETKLDGQGLRTVLTLREAG